MSRGARHVKTRQAGPQGPATAVPAKPVAALDEITLARVRAMLGTPSADGWRRLVQLLQAAQRDPLVRQSAGALELAALYEELAAESLSAATADEPLRELVLATPEGRKGAKFTRPGRSRGDVKKLVAEVLPELEASLRRKAKAEEVWRACARRRRRNMEFIERSGEPDHVWVDGTGPTPWSRFRVIVSEVRAGK